MAVAPLNKWIDERTRLLPLRVTQYHAMMRRRIIMEGAPYELLEGYVVRKDRSAAGEDPMTISHHHAWAVKKLGTLAPKFLRLGCHLQTQQPVTLPPHNEPEPDGAIVLGSEDDFRERHPGAKDVLCAIEVADASLRHDRTIKLQIYASHGISTYIIINLAEQTVEVYTQPVRGRARYDRSATLSARQSVVFPAAKGRGLTVPVRRLLP